MPEPFTVDTLLHAFEPVFAQLPVLVAPHQPHAVASLVAAGRTRWKVKNEGNNTLKTKGYHFEHNFGHGQQHLAAFLLTLILLAFLCHTVLDLLCI